MNPVVQNDSRCRLMVWLGTLIMVAALPVLAAGTTLTVQFLGLPKADVYRIVRTEGILTVSNVQTFITTRQAENLYAPVSIEVQPGMQTEVVADKTQPYASSYEAAAVGTAGGSTQTPTACTMVLIPTKYDFTDNGIRVNINNPTTNAADRFQCKLVVAATFAAPLRAHAIYVAGNTNAAPIALDAPRVKNTFNTYLHLDLGAGEATLLGTQDIADDTVFAVLITRRR